MIVKIEQKSRELYAADFNIVCQNMQAGKASFTGHMGSMEGEWKISFMGMQIEMRRVHGVSSGFRPYSVSINSANCGTICHMEQKTGFLKPRIGFYRLELNGVATDMFPIGMGEIINAPVLMADRQVALVEKPLTICNGLHLFSAFVLSESNALQTLLLALYMYSYGCYKAGEKPVQGVHKGYVLSKEKELLGKYDPGFKASVTA